MKMFPEREGKVTTPPDIVDKDGRTPLSWATKNGTL